MKRLALAAMMLAAAAWLGHYGADRFARAAAFEAEVAGLGPPGGDNEIDAVRRRSVVMLGAAGVLLVAAFAVVRVD